MTSRRATGIGIGLASVLAWGCGAAQPDPADEEPIGFMPTAVTQAQPEWLPFAVLAGEAVGDDPSEPHLQELRRLPFEGDVRRATWSPDGRSVLLEGVPNGGACSQVYWMDLGTGDTRRLSTDAGTASGAVFIGSDEMIFAGSLSGCPDTPLANLDLFRAALPKGATEPPVAPPKPLFPSPSFDGAPRSRVGVGVDARPIVLFQSARDGDLELYVGDVASEAPTRITDAVGFDGEGDLAPNGARVVWSASRPRGAELDAYRRAVDSGKLPEQPRELWIATVGGKDARALTANGGHNATPAFFPDSRHVIFASTMGGLVEGDGAALYVVDADGPPTSGGYPQVERLTARPGNHRSPAVSPDGKYLLFTAARGVGPSGGKQSHLYIARWVEDPNP